MEILANFCASVPIMLDERLVWKLRIYDEIGYWLRASFNICLYLVLSVDVWYIGELILEIMKTSNGRDSVDLVLLFFG